MIWIELLILLAGILVVVLIGLSWLRSGDKILIVAE
jgi:hypothetical protein